MEMDGQFYVFRPMWRKVDRFGQISSKIICSTRFFSHGVYFVAFWIIIQNCHSQVVDENLDSVLYFFAFFVKLNNRKLDLAFLRAVKETV